MRLILLLAGALALIGCSESAPPTPAPRPEKIAERAPERPILPLAVELLPAPAAPVAPAPSAAAALQAAADPRPAGHSARPAGRRIVVIREVRRVVCNERLCTEMRHIVRRVVQRRARTVAVKATPLPKERPAAVGAAKPEGPPAAPAKRAKFRGVAAVGADITGGFLFVRANCPDYAWPTLAQALRRLRAEAAKGVDLSRDRAAVWFERSPTGLFCSTAAWHAGVKKRGS